MTDCTTKPIEFARTRRKNVVADFNGGRITSDAGALLLREVERKLRLFDRIDDLVRDPRDPKWITHQQRTLVAQRIAGIACGYEDLNDHQALRDDPLFQLLCREEVGEGLPLASPSTLCRLENRVGRDELVDMSRLLVEMFIESFDAPPKEIILDFDATDDTLHGDQVGKFFHGYYDSYCFLPLYVFAGDQLLCAYLRPSKIDGAKHAWAILALLTKRLREEWPDVKIVFRGDGGFCRWRMLRWCDNNDVYYIVGIGKNKRLTALGELWIDAAHTQYIITEQEQRMFTDFLYSAKTWDRRRRVIQKSEYTSRGTNTRYVVTNLSGDSKALYDSVYCARGEMENRIKEQQRMLFADRTSCHEFYANQFRLMLSSFAYVLIETFRRTALVGTEMAKSQCSTIREKLLKIGARIVVSARRVVLHLSSGYPLAELFRAICDRLTSTAGPHEAGRIPITPDTG